MTVPRLLAFLTLGALQNACGAPAPADSGEPFEVSFRAITDDGDALAGVSFATGKKKLSMTGSSGTSSVKLEGTEGQVLPVTAECPEGYASSEKPQPLRLTRSRALGNGQIEPNWFQVTCTRKLRDVVVVVRAEGGGGLGVRIDGKSYGTTDPDGNAHVLLKLERDIRSLGVALDTSARPGLKPESPSRTFELSGRDAVLLVEQRFAQSPRPKPALPKSPLPAPRRHIPERLN